jgi:hypothetical protein
MTDPIHGCPGGCARQVRVHFYACKPCWFRLPYRLRQPILHARQGTAEHRAAMADAAGWYRANPKPTSPSAADTARLLADLEDLLAGRGRHADHTRHQAGRYVVCSCGDRAQGRLARQGVSPSG